MLSLTRRAAVGLVAAQRMIRAQSAPPITYLTLKPALDAIYAVDNGLEPRDNAPGDPYGLRKAEAKALLAIREVVGNAGSRADECAAILWQFSPNQAFGPEYKAEVIQRGPKLLPYLIKYRDLVFPTPYGAYPRGIHWSPASRRHVYDEVIETIQKRPYYGLPPGVDRLVVPFLDGMSKGNNEQFWDRIDKVLALRTPLGDQAIVILLDYPSDAAYSQMLRAEIFSRGKRMIPLLRRRLTDFSITLSKRYAKSFKNTSRNDDIERLIQGIELGEAVTAWP